VVAPPGSQNLFSIYVAIDAVIVGMQWSKDSLALRCVYMLTEAGLWCCMYHPEQLAVEQLF